MRIDLICEFCGTDFKRPQRTGLIPKYCSIICRNRCWVERHPEKKQKRLHQAHDASLRRNYGIDAATYADKLKSQNGGCAICGTTPNENGRRLCVDHNHYTGALRGLLCDMCNHGLGHFLDSRARLDSALRYIKKWRT